jgi:hypothetical protein
MILHPPVDDECDDCHHHTMIPAEGVREDIGLNQSCPMQVTPSISLYRLAPVPDRNTMKNVRRAHNPEIAG